MTKTDRLFTMTDVKYKQNEFIYLPKNKYPKKNPKMN